MKSEKFFDLKVRSDQRSSGFRSPCSPLFILFDYYSLLF